MEINTNYLGKKTIDCLTYYLTLHCFLKFQNKFNSFLYLLNKIAHRWLRKCISIKIVCRLSRIVYQSVAK